METLGIAPEAQLVIMKVFDMDGMCYFDYLIAAMEDAIALGVDCANLSLGSACGPHYYEGMTEVYDAAGRRASTWWWPPATTPPPATGVSGARAWWNPAPSPPAPWACPGTFDSVLTVASMENPQEVSFEAIRGLSPSAGTTVPKVSGNSSPTRRPNPSRKAWASRSAWQVNS